MNGTEKQIEWAKRIIKSIENSAKNTIKEISEKKDTRLAKLIAKEKDSDYIERIMSVFSEQIKEVEEVFEYIPKIKEASNVIGLRLTAERAEKGRMSANWRKISAEVALMAGIRL